ncbi:hypothetical protein ACHAXA_001554 [Cyclostephanos tholiformis]|uniref:Uncharacterized protein n=1 Tax=Cyclostephanos tholiformis TaxID=382380 RepID=A0ABD3R6B6_9STRA
MRFMLRPFRSPPASVGKLPSASASGGSAVHDAPVAGPVAYGQRCGSNCGCVLRIEAELSPGCTSTGSACGNSPTIVRSSYVARRVVTTTCDDGIRLRPLTTQHRSRAREPILTSCPCPTLHHMARRTVKYLEGKTLDRVRNEMEMGVAGPRSTVAFRHTVLRECVVPAIVEATRGGMKRPFVDDRVDDTAASCTGVDEMNSTTPHVHCYDLVEDTLLSMIHERMPGRRSDDMAESYSPTLGGYFRMYSSSGRRRSADIVDDAQRNESAVAGQESAIHEESGWLRKSPSSYFLFGDEPNNGANAGDSSSFIGVLMQCTKDYFGNQLLGDETKISAPIEYETGQRRPTTTYLQMLDIYGSDAKKMDEDRAMADWLEYVDSQDYNMPTSA